MFEKNFGIGRIFAMEGSRSVLVEVVLFQVRSTKTRLELSIHQVRPVIESNYQWGSYGILVLFTI